MEKPKKPVKYQGVSLPITMIDSIRKHIANNDNYRGVPEFVRDAIREKMRSEQWVGKDGIRKRDLIPAGLEKYTDFMIRAAGGNPSDYYPDDDPAMEKKQNSTDIDKRISNLEKKLETLLSKRKHADDSEK